MTETSFRNSDDDELLARAYSGEQAALSVLVDRHRDYLKKVIDFRLDDRLAARLDASDIVQETLLEACQRVKRDKLRPELPVRLWLRQLAIDRTKMAQRRHVGAQRRTVGREVAMPSRSSIILARHCLQQPPDDLFEKQEVISAVRLAVADLSEMDRTILTMRTFEGLTYKEIEIVANIAAATARKRFGRALMRLQERLQHLLSGDHNES